MKSSQIEMELKNSQSFSAEKMTLQECTKNLITFQNDVLKIITRETGIIEQRLSQAAEALEEYAANRGMSADSRVAKGIAALRTINTQTAIAISGLKGENNVARAIKAANRTDKVLFRNINVTDGNRSAELDTVIITDAGIIIIETKRTAKNIEITRQGYMKYGGSKSGARKTLCQQMNTQRYLLKKSLVSAIRSQGLKIPVVIDSFVVFDNPGNREIVIDDNSRLEKWCCKTELSDVIERYSGQVRYTHNQVLQLKEIMSHMSRDVKSFKYNFYKDDVSSGIAEMIAALTGEEEEPLAKQQKTPTETKHKDTAIIAYVSGFFRKVQQKLTQR